MDEDYQGSSARAVQWPEQRARNTWERSNTKRHNSRRDDEYNEESQRNRSDMISNIRKQNGDNSRDIREDVYYDSICEDEDYQGSSTRAVQRPEQRARHAWERGNTQRQNRRDDEYNEESQRSLTGMNIRKQNGDNARRQRRNRDFDYFDTIDDDSQGLSTHSSPRLVDARSIERYRIQKDEQRGDNFIRDSQLTWANRRGSGSSASEFSQDREDRYHYLYNSHGDTQPRDVRNSYYNHQHSVSVGSQYPPQPPPPTQHNIQYPTNAQLQPFAPQHPFYPQQYPSPPSHVHSMLGNGMNMMDFLLMMEVSKRH